MMPDTARIIIAGLGAGAPGDLTLGAWKALKSSPRILLRTGRHPVVEWLGREGIAFITFDSFYEQAHSFQEVYARIAEASSRRPGTSPYFMLFRGTLWSPRTRSA